MELLMVSYVERDTFEIFQSNGSDSPGVAVYLDPTNGVIATPAPSSARAANLSAIVAGWSTFPEPLQLERVDRHLPEARRDRQRCGGRRRRGVENVNRPGRLHQSKVVHQGTVVGDRLRANPASRRFEVFSAKLRHQALRLLDERTLAEASAHF